MLLFLITSGENAKGRTFLPQEENKIFLTLLLNILLVELKSRSTVMWTTVALWKVVQRTPTSLIFHSSTSD
ncbi:hypothetical protein EmuJ_000758600 [Echinococcus multilocularis]|uniref:Uncharacterized protein n=1 Tax=Echinococcus multilocularis TaxID=6211 RepID=A0A068Y5G3_ECHMU|nr:hypothetical protein EmuJ_000758600 [Echinococcus multilocularis]